MKRCEPFQDFGGNKFYVPMDNGRLLGTGTNGNPCSFKPASSHDYSGIGLGQVGGDRYRISNPFNTKPSEFSVYSPLYTPQFQPYVRPEFVPYTQSSQSFIPEPKYINDINLPQKSTPYVPPIISYFTQSGGFNFSLFNLPSFMIGTLEGMTGHYNSLSEQNKVVARELDCPSYSGGILNFNQMQINTSNMDRCISMNDIAYVIRAKAREGWNSSVLSNITTLQFSNAGLHDYHLTELMDSLVYQILNLDKFDFHGNHLTGKGAEYIFYSIRNTFDIPLHNIKHINLSNNKIDDWGVEHIAQSLINGRFPHLKTLRLEGNKITTTGTGFLSKALEVVEQNINVVLKSIQNASKSVAQFAIKEMLHIAKSNGISTKEVLTNQETIDYCKKGIPNVVGNLGLGYFKCWTKLDKPIAVYEMDFQYVATALMVNIMNPAKKPVQVYCTIESTVFSVVDEEFANCLTGLDSELNND